MVLKSGRVVRGMIQSQGNGYEVALPSSRLFVGSEQVWLLADSLPEAYQTIRDSFSVLTPDVHLQIAAWCEANQMWGTARRELLDALHLDPHRDDAKRRLAQVMRRQQAATPSDRSTSIEVQHAIRNGMALPRRTLGGLPSSLATQFTTHVQPLLVSKCASCHGAGSDRAFRVQAVGSRRRTETTQQNLAAVLQQIETASTDVTFLSRITEAHGGMQQPPIAGRFRDRQQQLLTEWIDAVRTVRPSSGGGNGNRMARSQAERGGINRAETLTPAGVTPVNYTAPDVDPHRARRRTEYQDKVSLSEAARRNRSDAFDPDIFNQKHAGTSGSARNFGRSPH